MKREGLSSFKLSEVFPVKEDCLIMSTEDLQVSDIELRDRHSTGQINATFATEHFWNHLSDIRDNVQIALL